MTFRIRMIGPEDAAAILQADVFDGPAQSEYVDRFLGHAMSPDPRNLMFVAEVAGRIVGFVSGMIQDHPDKPSALYIGELGVDEDHQRKGIARALIRAIRARGREKGCTVTWVVAEGDNIPALNLYDSMGAEMTPDVVMFTWPESAAP